MALAMAATASTSSSPFLGCFSLHLRDLPCRKCFQKFIYKPSIKALYWQPKKTVDPPEMDLSLGNFMMTRIKLEGERTGPDTPKMIYVSILLAISEVWSSDWDTGSLDTSGPEEFNPFLTHGFLSSVEESGSAIKETGWIPCHVVARDENNNVVGVVPLYLKSHSYGEYVFDHSWADAYYNSGARYYPKLQCCVPFTPVTGQRILARNTAYKDQVFDILVSAMKDLAVKVISKVSALASRAEEIPALEKELRQTKSALEAAVAEAAMEKTEAAKARKEAATSKEEAVQCNIQAMKSEEEADSTKSDLSASRDNTVRLRELAMKAEQREKDVRTEQAQARADLTALDRAKIIEEYRVSQEFETWYYSEVLSCEAKGRDHILKMTAADGIPAPKLFDWGAADNFCERALPWSLFKGMSWRVMPSRLPKANSLLGLPPFLCPTILALRSPVSSRARSWTLLKLVKPLLLTLSPLPVRTSVWMLPTPTWSLCSVCF